MGQLEELIESQTEELGVLRMYVAVWKSKFTARSAESLRRPDLTRPRSSRSSIRLSSTPTSLPFTGLLSPLIVLRGRSRRWTWPPSGLLPRRRISRPARALHPPTGGHSDKREEPSLPSTRPR